MKSKFIQVSQLDLNNLTEIEYDLRILTQPYLLNGTLIKEEVYLYPLQIILRNNTNKTVSFILLDSENEKQIRQQYPQWFDFIPIYSEETFNKEVNSKSSFLILNPHDKPYTGNFEITTIGYAR